MSVKLRKLTAFFLVVIMIFGIFAVIPFTVSAANVDFKYAFMTDSGEAVTSIDCPALKDSINLSSVTYIDGQAFNECDKFLDTDIPEDDILVDGGTFDDSIWSDDLPDGIIYIGTIVYGYKGEMPENTSITLKDGTTEIANNAFEGYTNLVSVTIPDSVTVIGSGAFRHCRDDLTIYGYPDTEAERFAKEEGFKFVSLGDVPISALGDVDGDGKVSIDDVTDIQKYIANTMDFTARQKTLADVDKDEKVSIDDVTLIQKYLAGMAAFE